MYTIIKVVIATVAASFLIAAYPANAMKGTMYVIKGATYIESNVSALVSGAHFPSASAEDNSK